MQVMLRWILGNLTAILLFVVVTAACAPAAGPAPSTSPVPPTPAPAGKPAAATSPTAKPAATPAGSAAGATWKADWDKLLAAAKQEGKAVVAGAPGSTLRDAMMGFHNAYPDIQLEYTGIRSTDYVPKILAERQGGLYLWDVIFGGSTEALTTLRPSGALDPLNSAFLLPEVLDDSKWLGGFDDAWMDKEHQYVFNFQGEVKFNAFVNRSIVTESELNKFDQLLDPEWKGKIVSRDPRKSGPASETMGQLILSKGEAWVRKLLAQDLVIMDDARAGVEAVVRARYPIGFLTGSAMADFEEPGLLKDVKPLDPTGIGSAALTNALGNLSLMNKAPHPNAAKVFINWLLTKDGQQAFAKGANSNSRRLDVVGAEATAPKPDVKYILVNKEELLPNKQRAMEIAKEIIK